MIVGTHALIDFNESKTPINVVIIAIYLTDGTIIVLKITE